MRILKGIVILLAIAVIGLTGGGIFAANQVNQEFVEADSFMLPEARLDIIDIILGIGRSFGWQIASLNRDGGRIIFTNAKSDKNNFYFDVVVRGARMKIGVYARNDSALMILESFKKVLFERFRKGITIP